MATNDLQVKFNVQNIEQLAEQAGITSGNALAQRSGIATPNYYENMAGKTFPSLKTMIRLLQGLGRSPEEIRNTTLGELLIIEALPEIETAP